MIRIISLVINIELNLYQTQNFPLTSQPQTHEKEQCCSYFRASWSFITPQQKHTHLSGLFKIQLLYLRLVLFLFLRNLSSAVPHDVLRYSRRTASEPQLWKQHKPSEYCFGPQRAAVLSRGTEKQASRDYSLRTFGLKEADQFSDDGYRVYL